MKCLPAILLLLCAACAAIAQSPQPSANVAVSTVTFDVVWEASTPQQITITVPSSGETKYVSSNPTKPPDENGVRDEDFQTHFTVSAATRDKIFSLAEQARYFDGNFDYKKHNIANTGRKTLSYTDSTRRFATVYNWSENPAVDQLTRMFQGISNVVEHGRKIQFLRRYDKLGLEAELKAMEEELAGHYLTELQIIAPTLESVANDPAILHIARERAKRLLTECGKHEASATPAR